MYIHVSLSLSHYIYIYIYIYAARRAKEARQTPHGVTTGV